MDTPLPPPHPLDALTTYELSRYRRQLEHALKALPGHAPARGQLQQRRAEVMAELQSRTAIIPNGPGSCPPSALRTLSEAARRSTASLTVRSLVLLPFRTCPARHARPVRTSHAGIVHLFTRDRPRRQPSRGQGPDRRLFELSTCAAEGRAARVRTSRLACAQTGRTPPVAPQAARRPGCLTALLSSMTPASARPVDRRPGSPRAPIRPSGGWPVITAACLRRPQVEPALPALAACDKNKTVQTPGRCRLILAAACSCPGPG